MKKNVLLSLLIIGLLPIAGFAQCCNVYASSGTVVTTTDGSCVALSYPTSDCLVAAVIVSSKDTDGDGVSDSKDKCPTIKGLAENNGCPTVSSEVWTLFYAELKDVRFANNSDSLNSTSLQKLDNVARLMQTNKDYTLKVSGYADSVGTERNNKNLSGRRAIAVKNYLVTKGVNESKIVLAAYGEKFPEAPNETAKGRSKNRRVEFDLFY